MKTNLTKPAEASLPQGQQYKPTGHTSGQFQEEYETWVSAKGAELGAFLHTVGGRGWPENAVERSRLIAAAPHLLQLVIDAREGNIDAKWLDKAIDVINCVKGN